MTVAAGVLTFKRNTDETCKAVFDTGTPGELRFDIVIPGRTPPAPKKGCVACAAVPTLHATYVLRFDPGVRLLAAAKVDAARRRIELDDNQLGGELVFFSSTKNRWLEVKLASGVAEIDAPDSIAEGTKPYFRPDQRSEVLEVALRPPTPPVDSELPNLDDAFATTCAAHLKAVPQGNWYATLDAKGGNTLVVEKPARIVDPNTFGHVIVRHSSQYATNFSSTGTVGLYEPAIREGKGQSGDKTALDGARATKKQPKLVCSVYEVAPRQPGAYAITVKLVDPAKDADKNTVSSQPLDVVVLERYRGAFRTGVAAIFGASDQDFEARTLPNSSQAEIVRSSRTPFELVVGYSHFLFAPRGRSYFSYSGAPVQDSRLGLFFGFGAVSFDGDNFDYLKSLHLGVEYELTQNLSLAVTAVVRRVEELSDGARVGSPTGTNIPTETRYAAGGAIVLNISPKFFSFAASVGEK